MKYFPLGINLQEKTCLVVGGGDVAYRKVSALLKSNATISVASPELNPSLTSLHNSNTINWLKQSINNSEASLKDLISTEYHLVIAATNDRELNQSIGLHCQTANILVNVASDSEQGNLLIPAIIERDKITVAMHTNGQSPTLTRFLKRQLEAFIPKDLGKLSTWAESWRKTVAHAIPSQKYRRLFWEHTLSSSIQQKVLSNRVDQANALMEDNIRKAQDGSLEGQVFLVGAGPGDPELLTLKALKLIQQSDVVLYDRLVSEEIMALVPSSAERIYVGKKRADHAVPQHNINQLLADVAKQGKRVLRLKGGDPFIFGRGGEELELLVEQGISFQVVPGITAASGCASYAGIPLTHRDYAQSVRFIAGHLKSPETPIDWGSLAKKDGQTLVFYMGLTELPTITRQLIKHGLPSNQLSAIIEKGTTSNQRVITSPLSELHALSQKHNFKAPTLIIIGDVVSLQSKLNWYN